jgi:hypothetical protein
MVVSLHSLGYKMAGQAAPEPSHGQENGEKTLKN